METTKRCPHCGATLPEGSIYCYKCGTKIETPADIPDYSQLVDNTSTNPQDQNIPIDDLLGQTHVINSLMSELDSIVNGDDFDTPVTPSVKPANEDTATHDVPINTSMNHTEGANSSKEEDSNTDTNPFAWEIPSFNPSSSSSQADTFQENTIESTQEETKPVEERKPLSRAARHRHVIDDTESTITTESNFDEDDEEEKKAPAIKKEKKKKKSFLFDDEDEDYDDDDYDDEDEDFEDEYAEKHVWPIVLGIILLVVVVTSVLLVLFKPDIVNKGIDGVNNIFNTEIKHIGATPEPLETVSPVTADPTETIDTTIYDAEHAQFSAVAHLYSSFYKEYINAYNTGDIQSLNHVSDSLKAEIQDRYTNYNSGLGFEAKFTYIDLDSYVISDIQEDGYYNISFNTYQENRCWDKETNEEKDNNPTMAVSMRYNPETGDYYLSSMKIDGSITLGNRMIDVTAW